MYIDRVPAVSRRQRVVGEGKKQKGGDTGETDSSQGLRVGPDVGWWSISRWRVIAGWIDEAALEDRDSEIERRSDEEGTAASFSRESER